VSQANDGPAGQSSECAAGGRILRLFGDVRTGETTTVLILLVDIFILLASYYIIKVVREPLVLISAEQDLNILMRTNLPVWLREILQLQGGPQLKAGGSACMALLLVGFIPLFSWFSSKVKRLYFLVGVTLFFILNLVLFYILSLVAVPFLGFIFYVWVGIFDNSMVALFWSFANDVYSRAEGNRLFPVVAIGATAGAPVGSLVAEELKNWSPYHTMLLTAGLLFVFLALSLVVHFRESGARRLRGEESPAPDHALKSGSAFRYVFQSRYVLLIGFLLLALNVVNTSGELILSNFVRQAASAVAPGHEGPFVQGFYGSYNLWSSIVAFALQAFLVSRIVKYMGLRGVLFILPVLAFGAYGVISLGAGLGVVRWLKIAENSTDYSIMNTGKAMLWLPTSREEKYKAKQTVDTFFVRFGDFIAALVFIAGTTSLGFGIRTVAGINVGVVLVWLSLTFFVLKNHRKLGSSANGSSRE
jgi:AAA family ATP:ADP antiporter